MLRQSLIGGCVVSLLVILVGCGGNSHLEDGPGNTVEGPPVNIPGLTFRAVSPSGLMARTLTVKEANLTAFFGSPLMYLSHAPLTLTGEVRKWGVTATIPVSPRNTIKLVITPDGTTAYVTGLLSPQVSVVDLVAQTETATIPIEDGSVGLAITPDGTTVYVTNYYYGDTVSVIDVASNTVTTTISVGYNPHDVAFTPDGTTAYVPCFGEDYVSVVDVASNTVTTTIPVVDGPAEVDVSPDGTTAYVTCEGSDDVSVIDVASNTVTITIPVGDHPQGVTFTPDGTTAYVTCGGSDDVSVIDVASNTVTTTIPVGDAPIDVATTPDGTAAFVSNGNDDNVSVIDVASNTVVYTIPVGDSPRGIAFTPDGKKAYVANVYDDTITVIESTGIRVFIGEPGQDQEYDPPFGQNRAGAIVGRNATGLTTCMMVDAAPPDSLKVDWEKPYPANTGQIALATLTAEQITELWVDGGQAGTPPHKLISDSGALFGNNYSMVLLDFTVQGNLVNVIPTKSRTTRQRGKGYEVIDRTDGTITLHGDFAGIYEVASDQDVAPGGAQMITLDAGTGEVLRVE